MEDVPTPNIAATIRVAQKISVDLLQRGAKMREAADLGEMLIAIRYLNRHRPGMTAEQMAEFLEISRATYYRRRERFQALTKVTPEAYPLDVSSLAPPMRVAMGLVDLPAA